MNRGLGRYIAKRLGFAGLMLAGVSVILFTLMRLAPGGPEAVLIGGEFSPEVAAQVRQRLGLDRPLPAQYASWVLAALKGDLGRSFKTGDPVLSLILDRLGPTLQLTGGALLLALVVAVPLGVLAAVRRDSVWDTLASGVSLFGVSFPSFWLGIMLILLFSEAFHLLPPSGLSEYGREGDVGARLRHAALPTLTLGLIQEQRRDFDESAAAFQRAVHLSPQTPRMHGALGRTFALSGRRKQALEVLRKLEAYAKERYVSPLEFAWIQFALGDVDLGFRWMTKACEDRVFDLISIKVDPRFDSLRGDRRFAAIARQLGVP